MKKTILIDKIMFLRNDRYNEFDIHYGKNQRKPIIINKLLELNQNIIISIIPDKSRVMNNIISKYLNKPLNDKNYYFHPNIIDHFTILNNNMNYISPSDTHYTDLAYYMIYVEIQKYLNQEYIKFDMNQIKYIDDPKDGDLMQTLNNSKYTKDEILTLKLPFLDEKLFYIENKIINLHEYDPTKDILVKLTEKIKFTETLFGDIYSNKYWDILIETINENNYLVDKSILILCDSNMRFQQKYFTNTYKKTYIYRNKSNNYINNLINLIKPNIILYSRIERFLY
jgi:hypothetical protein